MSIKFFKNIEKGIGLVETIVALGISIVVLTSLVSLALYTLRSSQQSKYMLEASKLATEELERVRAARDSMSWSTLVTGFKAKVLPCDGTPKCYVTTALAISSVPATGEVVGTYYTRYFTVTQPATDVLRIAVTVSYAIGGQTKYVRNYTDLTNWRNN